MANVYDLGNLVRCKGPFTQIGVTAISVTSGGSNFTAQPNVTITGGGGSSATATATVVNGAVTAITVGLAGQAFTTPPTVTITGGGGTGATATATIGPIPIDPSTVEFIAYKPDGATEFHYIYGTDPQLVRESTGLYHVDVSVDQAGKWTYRWLSTGAGQASSQNAFYVAKDTNV